MLNKLFVLLVVFYTVGFANNFNLSTVVYNEQLVPVIKINGKIVIKVKDVGTKQVFFSPFERSEKIFKALSQYKNQDNRLNGIRIRRNKADYVAYIDNIEVYRVTPLDIIGTDFTVYQMAVKWRDNIVSSLKLKTEYTQSVSENKANDDVNLMSSPLISLLSLFSNNSFFEMIFQLIIFVLIQVCTILLTIYFINRRYKNIIEDLQKRLKRFNHSQIKNKNLISNLSSQIENLSLKMKSKDKQADNISNL